MPPLRGWDFPGLDPRFASIAVIAEACATQKQAAS